MTKPIQRHRLKPGPKPKVNPEQAIQIVIEAGGMGAATEVLGISPITLRKAVQSVGWLCPRCEEPNERHTGRAICRPCVYKQSNSASKIRQAQAKAESLYQSPANRRHELNKEKGWLEVVPKGEWKGWQFSASRDYLSRPLMGAQS